MAGIHRHKLKRASKWLHPKLLAAKYYKFLNVYVVKQFEDIINSLIIPKLNFLYEDLSFKRPINDTYIDDLKTIFNSTQASIDKQINPDAQQAFLLDTANNVNNFNKKQFKKVAKSVLGVDVFTAEPWLEQELGNFVVQNTSLIKSIKNQGLEDVKGVVTRGFQQGLRPEDITKQIQARYDIVKNRAKLIARDQIAKLNSNFSQLRQVGAGVSEYVWKTADDERVRALHDERDGLKFSWDNPPDDGNPGEPVNCRCYAEPVFDVTAQ